jgi:hypothetical protein
MNELSQNDAAPLDTTRPYRRPELKCYGDIQSLTKNAVAMTKDVDGASGMPSKTLF